MKTVGIASTTLDACIKQARRGRVLVTRNGKPVALVVGVAGMDQEQLQLGSSDRFWELMATRRKNRSISRAVLEKRLTR